MKWLAIVAMASALVASASPARSQAPGSRAPGPHASYVTVVVMENRNYDLIIGNPRARYVNRTLLAQGALLRNSHAVTHPSEPNYLALFSGATHGVTSDACPLRFSSANLASELIAAGKTFAGWSESMPRTGFTGCYTSEYARKHVPWVNFTNVPAADNRVYTSFPFPEMANVNFLIPNLCNDMHDCSTAHGDAWLAATLPAIVSWDARNNGLLIVTWDEADPDNGTNHIPTILVGPMVKAGASTVLDVDHYGVLRTIEVIFGLPCIANDCRAIPIAGVWQ